MSTVTSKLNISKVGRVCVTVADTDRALDFYVGKLGFEKVVDEPMGPDMRWVEVQVAGAETTIALAPPPQGQEAGGSQTGIFLDTTDVDADHAALKAAGVDVDDEVTALRRAGAADVLAPRPGRQLADRRPAVELKLSPPSTCGRSTSWRASGFGRGAPRPRAARALGAARLCGYGGGRAGSKWRGKRRRPEQGQPEEREEALRVEEERQLDDSAF